MKNKMTINEVVDKCSTGGYDKENEKLELFKDDHVFSEELTIKANREKIVEENKKINLFNRQQSRNPLEDFVNDLKSGISNDADLSFEQAELVYRYAWDEAHSYGYHEVISVAEDVVYLMNEIKAKA